MSKKVHDLTSAVDDFEIVDKDKSKSPYDWSPPHWVPNPVPVDYDIFSAPWIRPEQVPMSFVGEPALSPVPLSLLGIRLASARSSTLTSGANVIDTEHLKVRENMTVRIRKGLVESVEKTKAADMQEVGYSTIDAKGLYICPGLVDCTFARACWRSSCPCLLALALSRRSHQATRTSPPRPAKQRARSWARVRRTRL